MEFCINLEREIGLDNQADDIENYITKRMRSFASELSVELAERYGEPLVTVEA